MMHINFLRATCVAAGFMLTPALHAQVPEEQGPPEQQGPPAEITAPATPAEPTVQIPDTKVDQFAAAFVAVQDIQTQATQQLSAAKDDQAATAVKADAEKKMIEAVQKQGMEVEEFNRIADLMTTDLSLRARIVEKVEKRRKS
ncbi:MAG TPA: DUF4168 domain-containing protein [Povalibacter sp.]|nr:DUF4168 domain-containing protein [Povalibacter sp.]